MADSTLWIILIALLIAAIALWWLFGRRGADTGNHIPDIANAPHKDETKQEEKAVAPPAPKVAVADTAASPPPVAKVAQAPVQEPVQPPVQASAPPASVPPVAKASEPKPVAAKPEPAAAKPESPPKTEPAPSAKPKPTPKPAAAKPEPVPAPKPAAAKPAAKASGSGGVTAIGVAAAVGAPDNLLQLKGVGPKLNTLLGTLGITRFDQIAGWKAGDIEKVDAHLGTFKGRVTRDAWVEQASLLAKGDIAGFEAKFGKLDGSAV